MQVSSSKVVTIKVEMTEREANILLDMTKFATSPTTVLEVDVETFRRMLHDQVKAALIRTIG